MLCRRSSQFDGPHARPDPGAALAAGDRSSGGLRLGGLRTAVNVTELALFILVTGYWNAAMGSNLSGRLVGAGIAAHRTTPPVFGFGKATRTPNCEGGSERAVRPGR